MGPTNLALVKLFLAEKNLRDAQERLDNAARNVRIQDRRVGDLSEKLRLAQAALREQQSQAKQMELDVGSRDAHIEKLRNQQQTAKNNKEYQTFLVEISTCKVDKTKIEDELLKLTEVVEKAQQDVAALHAHLDAETVKLGEMKKQIGESLTTLQAEVDSLRPARDAAAAALPPRARDAFERLAGHHEGEAMAGIDKPDRRREEYICTACNMELARDVYNKLHSRDEIVVCPSCRRILYIPEDLTPDQAIGTGKPVVRKTTTRIPTPRAGKAKGKAGAGAAAEAGGGSGDPVFIEPRAKGKLGSVLTKAQGETVRSANAAGENPVECEVLVNGELAGIYKGQSVEKLERAVKYFMGEAGLFGDVVVRLVQVEAEAEADAPEMAVKPETAVEPATPASAPDVQGEAVVPPAESTATAPEAVEQSQGEHAETPERREPESVTSGGST